MLSARFEVMEIRRCTFDNETELQQLVDLQNEVYQKRGLHFTKDIFRYWYLDNPEGKVISYNAFDKGRLVAHQSFVPERMLVDRQITRCVRSMAVVTHPDYRGKGLLSQLTNAALEYVVGEIFDLINSNYFGFYYDNSKDEIYFGSNYNNSENVVLKKMLDDIIIHQQEIIK